MLNKIFKIIVQLYAVSFLSNKSSRMGRVVSTGSLKIDDVIAIAVSRRTDLNPATLMAGYIIMKDVVLEQILEGKYVEFGLSHYGLSISGLFEGDHPVWDSTRHELYLRATSTAEVRNMLKTIVKEVRGTAYVGIAINKLLDKESGKYNSRITPGGGVVLEGFRMKIEGEAAGVGLFLTNTETGQVTKIPATSILHNDPGMVSFIVPANLPAGDYRLSIVSQYSSSSVTLKEPRTYVFDHVLMCETDESKKKDQESEKNNPELSAK
jgi:hypothetical protein